MPIPDKNKQYRKYARAKSILTWMFFIFCVVNVLLRNSSFRFLLSQIYAAEYNKFNYLFRWGVG